MRLGYELIRADEIPGFEHLGLKSGDYPGVIGVNEWLPPRFRCICTMLTCAKFTSRLPP